MPFLKWKQDLASEVAFHLSQSGATPEGIFQELGPPPNLSMGHVAFPCFRLAKELKSNPNHIATQIATALQRPHIVATIAGPYVNFKMKGGLLFKETLNKLHSEGASYGKDTVGQGKKILIEYCSPNIAKLLAIHHIRSTLIGGSLSNLYRRLGYEVVRINFVGDWGTQFARLLAAFQMWGSKEKLTKEDVPGAMVHLGELYVRFHKDLESHPDWLEKAGFYLKKLEERDPEITQVWASIREISIIAMENTLKRIHTSFDVVEGESRYVEGLETALKEIKQKAGARLSEGAWIVDVEGFTTPALIQKTDGTTLYLTRDIAAAQDRQDRFQCDRMLYVVSEQQKLHFQLLFGVLKKMGHDWAERCEHVSFGTVLFGSEKMSTREGRAILLNDVLKEAHEKAKEVCSVKNPDLKEMDRVAEQVGVGAIIFGELSAHRLRDIEFDWTKMLAFDGETGPYVQYAAVRCQSLLEKAGIQKPPCMDAGDYVFHEEEELLLLELARFRAVLHDCIRENEPYYLTHYLIDVAKAYNRFYYRFPVLQAADQKQQQIRLSMVWATLQVLRNGFELLGMECPPEM